MEMIQKIAQAAPEVILAVVVLFGVWFLYRVYGNNKGHGSF